MTREYAVREGDTLATIASNHQMDWISLYNYDGGTGTPNRDRLRNRNPEALHPGDVILLPEHEMSLTGTSGGPTNVYVHPGSSPQADLLVQVTDACTGAPVPNAKVRVRDASGSRTTKITDACGDACFKHLPPGEVQMWPNRAGFDPVDRKPIQSTIHAKTVNRIEAKLRSKASIEVVRPSREPGQTNPYKADEQSPKAEYVRFGLWDEAYGQEKILGAYFPTVRNEKEESEHFVGADTRRFYFRVRAPSVPPGTEHICIHWKTLTNDGHDDDAPESQELRLERTRRGSPVFTSRAVMLTSDDTDQDYPTHSGFDDLGKRERGESNHRMRKAKLGGLVYAEYKQDPKAPPQSVKVPTFKPDELRRLPIRIVNYNGCADEARINQHMDIAQDRWTQVGLRVERSHYECRAAPPGMLDNEGRYHGENEEHPDRDLAKSSALGDLIPDTPDNMLTVAFVPSLPNELGHAANDEYGPIPASDGKQMAMENRFFIFLEANLPPKFGTFAHELHHVLFNRLDVPVNSRYFTFNTQPPEYPLEKEIVASIPDVRVQRRIQNANAPVQHPNQARTHPDDDPRNENVLNWVRRRRSRRYPIARPLAKATPTTGNTLVEAWNPYGNA